MSVLSQLLFDDGLILWAVIVVFCVPLFVHMWRQHRAHKRWLDEVAARRGKTPCIHRFVRVVYVAGADGKIKERYPQCMDCGERVLKNVIFMEED